MKKRILFVSATGGFGRAQMGGAERFLVEMLPALSSTFTIAALVPEGPIADLLEASGVQVYRGGPERRVSQAYRRRIKRVINEFHPDVVSAHLLSAAMHVRSLRLRSRLVVTLHNSMLQYVDSSRGKDWVRAVVNTALDRIQRASIGHDSVAVSAYESRELLAAPRQGNVVIIENPLPRHWSPRTISRTEARARLGLEAYSRVYGYVGRFEYEKGFDRIDSIAATLDDDEIIIAVGSGSLSAHHPKVLSFPRTDSPEWYYRACDAVVMPSRVEIFGRVAIEAITSCTGVAHSGTGGLSGVLADAEGQLAINVGSDPLSYHDALLSLAGRRSEPRAERVAKEYSRRYAFDLKVGEWCNLLERA